MRTVWLTPALFAWSSHAALRTYNFTVHTDIRAPDGVSREVYLINGQQPGPSIVADEGDELEIFVQNDLPVDTAIHWHGLLQRGTPHMDGVPGVTQDAIPPGGNFTYRFSLEDEYGFYWYHSHFRAYYNDAIRGPLLIRPSESRPRPFVELADGPDERAMLLQAERDAVSIMLNDWTHELSDTIFERYLETGAFPGCTDSILANGFGRVQCLPESVLQDAAGSGMEDMDHNESSMAMLKRTEMDMHSNMDMHSDMDMSSGMDMTLSPRGCAPPMMFRPGFNTSDLPPETCTNTSSPLLTISANQTQGWLALNLVNSGAVSALSVSLDGHSMFIYAADGLYVQIQEVKVLEIQIGQRYSVMVRLDQTPGDYYLRFAAYPNGHLLQVLEGQAIVSYDMNMTNDTAAMNAMDDPASVWMFTNGSAKAHASALRAELLSPFDALAPPSGPADHTHNFMINQTGVVTWVVDEAPYTEPEIPFIQGNVSDGWQSNSTIHMPFNSTIDIIMRIANNSLDTMGHPMHLHGHRFWVLGSGTGSFPYESIADAPESLINLENPPYRDTANLPASGWAAIRYVTDNPGAWMFHCHIQWHIVTGMALVLVEGEDQLPALIGQSADATVIPPDASSAASVLGIIYRDAAITAIAIAAGLFFAW